MKVTFAIYAHPAQGTKAVKRGFSWPAFFFTWVWAFFKRMWLAGGVLLLLSTGLTLLSLELVQVAPVFFACLGLVFQLILGLNGNSWLVKALEYRGFGYLCSITAKSPTDALAKLATVGG